MFRSILEFDQSWNFFHQLYNYSEKMLYETGSQAGIKFATPMLVVPIQIFKKNQTKFTYLVEAKITKFELGSGPKLIIHKIKLCS
jgi:hypothetical protein